MIGTSFIMKDLKVTEWRHGLMTSTSFLIVKFEKLSSRLWWNEFEDVSSGWFLEIFENFLILVKVKFDWYFTNLKTDTFWIK